MYYWPIWQMINENRCCVYLNADTWTHTSQAHCMIWKSMSLSNCLAICYFVKQLQELCNSSLQTSSLWLHGLSRSAISSNFPISNYLPLSLYLACFPFQLLCYATIMYSMCVWLHACLTYLKRHSLPPLRVKGRK